MNTHTHTLPKGCLQVGHWLLWFFPPECVHLTVAHYKKKLLLYTGTWTPLQTHSPMWLGDTSFTITIRETVPLCELCIELWYYKMILQCLYSVVKGCGCCCRLLINRKEKAAGCCKLSQPLTANVGAEVLTACFSRRRLNTRYLQFNRRHQLYFSGEQI